MNIYMYKIRLSKSDWWQSNRFESVRKIGWFRKLIIFICMGWKLELDFIKVKEWGK